MATEINTHGMATELTDEQVENASGGFCLAGDSPKFKVGDTVRTHSHFYLEGQITAVSAQKSGASVKEFTYSITWVRYSSDLQASWRECYRTETDVRESTLWKV